MTTPQAPVAKGAAKFEMYLGPNSLIHWKFVGAAGNDIVISKGTSIKEVAYQGIRDVKDNALIEQRYEKTTPAPGKFAFRLRAANHQVVAESVAYDKAEDRDEAQNMMRKAAEAVVVGAAI
jgi:uncharacterized protein YegP (UPF0339 family)